MKAVLLICLTFIGSHAFAQSENTVNSDINKLVKKENKEKGFVSEETFDLMRHLFKTVIHQYYADTLTSDLSPGAFNISIQNKQTTYFQYKPINTNRALFIWAVKENKQWVLSSHLEDSVDENTTFTYRYQNGFNFFIAPTYCICGQAGAKVWQRIMLTPSAGNYLELFWNCEKINDTAKFCIQTFTNPSYPGLAKPLKIPHTGFLNDTDIQNIQQAMDSNVAENAKRIKTIIKQQGQSVNLTFSDLLFTDLDNDGTDEIYWFSVSDKKLIDFNVYHLTNNGLIQLDSENYMGELKQTKQFDEVCKLSVLSLYKPKSFTKDNY